MNVEYLIQWFLQVTSSSSSVVIHQKEVSQGFPSFAKYTVHLADLRFAQGGALATITVTSSSTEQALQLPVAVIHATDPSTAMQGGFPFVFTTQNLLEC